MIRSRNLVMVLAVFAWALMVGSAQARIWHVPGDGHHLPTGGVIRADSGMPGVGFLEREVMGFGQWRDHAVFILEVMSRPGSSDQIRFENVTCRNSTRAVGPDQTEVKSLFVE